MTGPLRGQLGDYLALRRALGYRLARPEKLLNQFLDHLDRRGETVITVASALDCARLPGNGSSNWWAYRLSAVRGFTTYLHGIDPVHEGARTGSAAAAAASRQSVLVFRRRDRRVDRGRRDAVHPRSTSCRPRIHDLRHSFAVRSMLDAYAAGEDGQTRLTLLSTWLGHVMTAAGRRLEAHLAGRSAAR
jgi:integrase